MIPWPKKGMRFWKRKLNEKGRMPTPEEQAALDDLWRAIRDLDSSLYQLKGNIDALEEEIRKNEFG